MEQQDGATLYIAIRKKEGKSCTSGGEGIGRGMLGGPCHCWAHTHHELKSGCLGSQSGAVMNRGLSAASQDHSCSSLGNQDWGFCECFWREIVGGRKKRKKEKHNFNKQAWLLLNYVEKCYRWKIRRSLFTWKERQTYTWMSSFTVIFLLRHIREEQFQTQQKILAKGRTPFFLW